MGNTIGKVTTICLKEVDMLKGGSTGTFVADDEIDDVSEGEDEDEEQGGDV